METSLTKVLILANPSTNPKLVFALRMVPPLLLRIRSAHVGQYFCTVYHYVEKAGLSKGYQNPKRKLGVTTHFSEIIEPKFGKTLPYFLCILTLF